jgi:hypothetical protein
MAAPASQAKKGAGPDLRLPSAFMGYSMGPAYVTWPTAKKQLFPCV